MRKGSEGRGWDEWRGQWLWGIDVVGKERKAICWRVRRGGRMNVGT